MAAYSNCAIDPDCQQRPTKLSRIGGSNVAFRSIALTVSKRRMSHIGQNLLGFCRWSPVDTRNGQSRAELSAIKLAVLDTMPNSESGFAYAA